MAVPKKTAPQNSDSEEDILDVGHDVTATFDNSPSNPTERASSENLGAVREDDDLEEDLDEDEDEDEDLDEDDEEDEDEEDEEESADEYDEAEDEDDEEIDEDEDDEDIDADEEDEDEDDEDDLDTVPRASSVYRKM